MLEFDAPQTLLSDTSSQFSSLVSQAGTAEAGHLRMLARVASEKDKSRDQQRDNPEKDDLRLENEENNPLLG